MVFIHTEHCLAKRSKHVSVANPNSSTKLLYVYSWVSTLDFNCVTHLVHLNWKTIQKKIQCPEKCIPGVATRGQ